MINLSFQTKDHNLPIQSQGKTRDLHLNPQGPLTSRDTWRSDQRNKRTEQSPEEERSQGQQHNRK